MLLKAEVKKTDLSSIVSFDTPQVTTVKYKNFLEIDYLVLRIIYLLDLSINYLSFELILNFMCTECENKESVYSEGPREFCKNCLIYNIRRNKLGLNNDDL